MSSNPALDAKTRRRLRRMVEPSKRKRTLNACLTCKRRKQKCDGGMPCTVCSKIRIKCEYKDIPYPYPQLAKPGLGDSNGHPVPVVRASTGVGDISDISGNSGNTDNTSNSGNTDNTSNSGNTDNTDNTDYADNTDNSTTTTDTIEPVIATAVDGTATSTDYEVEKNDQTKADRLLCDPLGNLRYVGESSALSLLAQSRSLFRQINGESPFTQDPAQFNLVDGHIYRASIIPSPLPSLELAQRLVECFNQTVGPSTYVFATGELHKFIVRVYNDPLSASKSEICLLNIVFALGSLFYKGTNPQPHDASVFFQTGLGLLLDEFEDGDIWLVQAHFLNAIFYEIMCKRNAAWIQLGCAIRFAQALGLSRKGSNESYPPEICAHRRRLWRSLYVFDRTRSVTLGRPFAIIESDWNDANSLTETLDDQISNLTTQLCGILNEITCEIYSSRKLSSLVARQLANKLKQWSADLPELFQLKNLIGNMSNHHGRYLAYNDPNLKFSILTMNLIHLNAVILLTRPFFFFSVAQAKKLKSVVHPLQGPFSSFYSACVQSATLSIKLVSEFFSAAVKLKRPHLLIYFIFNDLLILCLEAFRLSPHIDALLDDSIHSGLEVLAAYGEENRGAKRYKEIIDKMYASAVCPQPPQSQPLLVDGRVAVENGQIGVETPSSHYAVIMDTLKPNFRSLNSADGERAELVTNNGAVGIPSFNNNKNKNNNNNNNISIFDGLVSRNSVLRFSRSATPVVARDDLTSSSGVDSLTPILQPQPQHQPQHQQLQQQQQLQEQQQPLSDMLLYELDQWLFSSLGNVDKRNPAEGDYVTGGRDINGVDEDLGHETASSNDNYLQEIQSFFETGSNDGGDMLHRGLLVGNHF